jgi:uncharacterized membrane protein
MSTEAPSSGGTIHCARHPGTETVLRCGRCLTPICQRCLVATPVGARCPTCAQVRRFATILKPADLARAAGLGLVTAMVGTAIVTFIPFLGLIGFAILGFAVGEAVLVGANRKRARELAPLAVAMLFVGYVLGTAGVLVYAGQPPSLVLLLVSLLSLTRGPVIIGLLIGALLAWMRAR